MAVLVLLMFVKPEELFFSPSCQWRHSLVEVILSYSSFTLRDITQAMFCLVKGENQVLERIELENLGVEMPLVR